MDNFNSWVAEQNLSENEIKVARAAWYAALEWVLRDQEPTAWMTNEEQPRFVSNRTKKTSLFKSAVESFNEPLFKFPHWNGKLNNG